MYIYIFKLLYIYIFWVSSLIAPGLSGPPSFSYVCLTTKVCVYVYISMKMRNKLSMSKCMSHYVHNDNAVPAISIPVPRCLTFSGVLCRMIATSMFLLPDCMTSSKAFSASLMTPCSVCNTSSVQCFSRYSRTDLALRPMALAWMIKHSNIKLFYHEFLIGY